MIPQHLADFLGLIIRIIAGALAAVVLLVVAAGLGWLVEYGKSLTFVHQWLLCVGLGLEFVLVGVDLLLLGNFLRKELMHEFFGK